MYVWMFIIGTVVTLIVVYLFYNASHETTSTQSQPYTPPKSNSGTSSKGFTMSQINSMSASDRVLVAHAIGCDSLNLSSIENLAISTVLIEKTIKLSATDSYLCKSPLCSCDTTIFTLFVVRALSLYACPTEEKARWFSDYYISLVVKGIKFKYSNFIPQLDEMIANRTAFYDRIFMSKSSLDDKLNAVFEEFEYVIKTDCINKEYSPFCETSPLPLLGNSDNYDCQIQVSMFCKNILRFLAPYYKETMEDMNV